MGSPISRPVSNIIGTDVSKASLDCAYLRDVDHHDG